MKETGAEIEKTDINHRSNAADEEVFYYLHANTLYFTIQ
jgi:hypothetical protein